MKPFHIPVQNRHFTILLSATDKRTFYVNTNNVTYHCLSWVTYQLILRQVIKPGTCTVSRTVEKTVSLCCEPEIPWKGISILWSYEYTLFLSSRRFAIVHLSKMHFLFCTFFFFMCCGMVYSVTLCNVQGERPYQARTSTSVIVPYTPVANFRQHV